MELILRFLEIKREVLFRHALSIYVKYSFIDFFLNILMNYKTQV